MHTPFYDAILALTRQDTARLHMPGHKGNPAALPALAGLLSFDITEVDGADDLSHPVPGGPLAQSQQNMAEAYGSGATLYSAAGSTACIQAMLTLFLRPGSPVVMVRGCHAAAIRALAFLDARPTWVLPRAGYAPLEALAAALDASHAKVLYLTSPDYYGHMADIPAIAALCHARGAVLLVDNAHGAHLRFGRQDMHPLSLGADAAADSAHKTLACLTPAAMLHLRDGALAPAARRALNLYSSTSPSYPVLLSLDLAAGRLLDNPPDFAGAATRLAEAARGSEHLLQPSDDPLRLCLRPALGGWPAKELYAAFTKAGVVPELYDGTHIVLMASPWNRPGDFDHIKTALQQFKQKKRIHDNNISYFLPETSMTIREATFAASRPMATKKSAGYVMSGIHAPCPPGVPLVLPGERITPESAAAMAAGGILTVDVVK